MKNKIEKTNLQKNILVIPTEKISFITNDFTLYSKEKILELEKIAEYKPRSEMEEDENFQQLIPYIAIKKGRQLFTYQRSNTGGEHRLYDKLTLGLGGHIDEPDDIISTVKKEIYEEIGLIVKEKDLNFIGIINTNKSSVDKVHIGIAIVIEIFDDEADLFTRGELDKILNRKLESKEELEEKKDQMEL